jgi:hypothetical protein
MLSLKACLFLGGAVILVVVVLISIAMLLGFQDSIPKNSIVLESRRNRKKGA